MNKKALYGILIALVVPITFFLIINALPKAAIPKPLFLDSVSTKIVNGKKVEDEFWHHVSNFTLTNQLGQKVSLSDVSLNDSGKIIVADFFYTRCPSVCLRTTRSMKKLQDGIMSAVEAGDTITDFVQFISFTIDPEYDSVPQLKKWADRFQVNPANWWLLTGDKKTIYDISDKDMRLGVMDPSMDSTFHHTDLFVLIDKHGVVRARRDKDGNPKLYHGLDSTDMANLAEDIVLLSLEKNPKKSFLRGELPTIAVSMLIAFIAVGIFLYFFRRKKE